MAYVDQGYTGPNAGEAAQSHGIRLEVVKHPMAKRGLFCCRAVGWSREASPGLLDSGGSCATTSSSTQRSKDFITSPSHALLSPTCLTTHMNFITGSSLMADSANMRDLNSTSLAPSASA